MLGIVFTQEQNTIKNMVGEGQTVPAPSMSGDISKKDGSFYLITSNKEMKIPEDLLDRIKIRKENNAMVAYSE
jgi:hypothetical protein